MPMPPIEIDRTSPVPIYFQLSRHLEETIDRSELVPGERLPTEIALAAALDISRPTVRRAIEELVGKGLEFSDNLYRADHYAIDVTVFNR